MDFQDTVTNVRRAVTLGEKMRKYWFRGHATVIGELTPRVFRPKYSNKFRDAFPPPVELGIYEKFRRRAPAVTRKSLPGEQDWLGWLTLMQHHRTPTRLLDWTANALVGLYFAVENTEEHGSDGELWVMDPFSLYEASTGIYALPIAREDPNVAILSEAAVRSSTGEGLAGEFGLEGPPQGPVPVTPVQSFQRIVAQQATLTIHPKPEEGNRITDLLSEPEALSRYRIPADEKESIRRALESLGITAGRLFPNLDGLSREIEEAERTIAEVRLEPPKFD